MKCNQDLPEKEESESPSIANEAAATAAPYLRQIKTKQIKTKHIKAKQIKTKQIKAKQIKTKHP